MAAEVEPGIYVFAAALEGDAPPDPAAHTHFAVLPRGEEVELFLLDEQLERTGLKERLPVGRFQERYRRLPHLDALFRNLAIQTAANGVSHAPSPLPPPPMENGSGYAHMPAGRQAVHSAPAPSPGNGRVKPQDQAEGLRRGDHAPWWDHARKGAERLVKE